MLNNLISTLQKHLQTLVIGQESLVERMLLVLLADGHLLVEGPPGLAKTRAIKSLSEGLQANFHRIQFTPDLLPADITGTDIYNPDQGTFQFQQGPVFHNLVLADEINRAPAKVQSALLEGMAERQISVGSHTYPLPDLFMVMATQNSIEQEGTYPLPEAQLDRFSLHVKIDYPNVEAERKILNLARGEAKGNSSIIPQKLSIDDIHNIRQEILGIHTDTNIDQYITQLVDATRRASNYDSNLAKWIEYGVSPRATIALDRCSKACAWLAGRDFVTPDDIQNIIHDVFRHRLIIQFEAQAIGKKIDDIIDHLLTVVAAP